MRCLLVVLFPALLAAAPPAIVDGPRSEDVKKNVFLVKWRTTEAAGASSTITCNLAVNSTGAIDACQIAAGAGGTFPAGSVVKIDRERMRVAGQSGDTVTLYRGHDPDYLRVWEGTLLSLAASGGTCTVTSAVDH